MADEIIPVTPRFSPCPSLNTRQAKRHLNYSALLYLYCCSSFIDVLFDTIVCCHVFLKFQNPKNDQKLPWTKQLILFSRSIFFFPGRFFLLSVCGKNSFSSVYLCRFPRCPYPWQLISLGGGISLWGIIALLVADRDGKVWAPDKQNCSVLPILCAFLHQVVSLLGQRFTSVVYFLEK